MAITAYFADGKDGKISEWAGRAEFAFTNGKNDMTSKWQKFLHLQMVKNGQDKLIFKF